MPDKTLEEQADELLAEYAQSEGKSLRKLGVLDKRRLATVRKTEIPMSSLFKKYRTGVLQRDDDEEER